MKQREMILQNCLAYAGRGWFLIPVHDCDSKGNCSCWNVKCDQKGKHPRIKNWPDFATTDEKTIRSWFDQWPRMNIGVVTGKRSGFFALDVDPRHDGDESLRDLQGKFGTLPDTPCSLTGGGGQHYLFNMPTDVVLKNKVGVASGLDIRGDGGQIVVPPSFHHSGNHYIWDACSHPDDIPIANAPAWLLEMIIVRPRSDSLSNAHSDEHWRKLVSSALKEGERNDTIASLAGHLLRRYVHPFVALELILSWNKTVGCPPLPDDEVKRTINSIAGLEKRRRAGVRKI